MFDTFLYALLKAPAYAGVLARFGEIGPRLDKLLFPPASPGGMDPGEVEDEIDPATARSLNIAPSKKSWRCEDDSAEPKARRQRRDTNEAHPDVIPVAETMAQTLLYGDVVFP